jgi:Signal transduction histidine kinase
MVSGWRDWSLRTRLTVLNSIANLVSALVLFGIALAVIGARTDEYVRGQLVGAARAVADALSHRQVLRPMPSGNIELVQLVDANGRVVSASTPISGRPPIAAFRPSRPGVPEDRYLCGSPAVPGCIYVLALTVDAPHEVEVVGGETLPRQRWVIYTATRHRQFPPPFSGLLIGAVALMTVINAFLTYRVIDRTLRPVRVIRSELAEITATDLGRRVTVPRSHGEIEQLASTVNRTLDLLEGLVEQQRRFASDASHELRSPLTAMRAQVEEGLLAPEDTDWAATARAILASVDRLQAIVTDLLTIARLDAGGPQSRDLVDLAELARTELDRRPHDPRVRRRLEPGVVVVGDLLRLTRLLTNLLDNAERHAREEIVVTVRRDPDAAVLEVLDDGAGIPPEYRETVFQRFTRLDAARSRDAGGTGLGLAIARQIAETHGGTLTIEDSPRGARFVLRLPYPEVNDEAGSRSR